MVASPHRAWDIGSRVRVKDLLLGVHDTAPRVYNRGQGLGLVSEGSRVWVQVLNP